MYKTQSKNTLILNILRILERHTDKNQKIIGTEIIIAIKGTV